MVRFHRIFIGCVIAAAVSSSAHASVYAQRATFTAPYAHPSYASRYEYPAYHQPFRWGWFGASHHPPAPQMHRDYNRGWKEWHYRR